MPLILQKYEKLVSSVIWRVIMNKLKGLDGFQKMIVGMR